MMKQLLCEAGGERPTVSQRSCSLHLGYYGKIYDNITRDLMRKIL